MAFTGKLGSADSKPGNIVLGVATSGGGTVVVPDNVASLTQSGTEALLFRQWARRRDRSAVMAVGVRGDIERPDAPEPLSASRPVWHTALSLPDVVKRLRSRQFLAVVSSMSRGDIEREDAPDPVLSMRTW